MRRKNSRKAVRTALQFIVLALAGWALYHELADTKRYVEPDRSSWTNRDGFIALSYFGVDRTGSPKLMSDDQLDRQIETLHDLGFVTISQQDIIDFYESGKPLPERALFLSFEDGRIDSSLYGQKILEKYQYRATFNTYANKIGSSEHKFVQPRELFKMKKTGFWELGTNGYRLTYINIFDGNGKFLGVIDESEISDKSHFEYYNHYLMDYIRDAHMIPIETRAEMEERIAEDYRLMEELYARALGEVPRLYMIMHANALYAGMNERVAAVNDAQIRRLFRIHFNREGRAFNGRDEDIHNLTRVQPAPYWSTNHLLMKIRADTGWDLPFSRGDAELADQWTVIGGAAEFGHRDIIVTSPPGAEGLIVLPASDGLADFRWTGKLAGNVIGKQSIYIRYGGDGDSYVRIRLENNRIHVDRKRPGAEEERVFSRQLDDIRWSGEDVAYDKASVYSLSEALTGRTEEPDYPINISHVRLLEAVVTDGKLRLSVDRETLLDGFDLAGVPEGLIGLAAEWNEQNRKEDIYDAVFRDVAIVGLEPGSGAEGEDGKAAERTVFTTKYSGWKEWMYRAESFVDNLIDWAIETF